MSEQHSTQLLITAKEAMKHAYAPYSGFSVGAAVLTSDGRVYSGCNIENASYGATNCAERTAIFKAVSEGCSSISQIAVVCSSGHFAYPCGICRQVIAEFATGDMQVILEDKDKGILELSFKDILPEAFTGKDLTSDDKQEE